MAEQPAVNLFDRGVHPGTEGRAGAGHPGRLTFTPQPAHGPGVIRFTGEGTLGPVVGTLPLRGVQGLVGMSRPLLNLRSK